jgi:hypothetical protein
MRALIMTAIAAGCGVLLFGSCSTARRSLAERPAIPGASFVGNKACAECRRDIA